MKYLKHKNMIPEAVIKLSEKIQCFLSLTDSFFIESHNLINAMLWSDLLTHHIRVKHAGPIYTKCTKASIKNNIALLYAQKPCSFNQLCLAS